MRTSRSSSFSSTYSSADSEETVQILVKLLSGEIIPLSLPTSTDIPTLYQLLALRTSLPPATLRLTLGGRHIANPHNPISQQLQTQSSSSSSSSSPQFAPSSSFSTTTLSDLSIPPNTTFTLSTPIRGGMPPKKIRCSFKDCKDSAQRIVGDCGFCNGHFCGKHRMLEDHKCSGLEDCKKESHERNAIKLNSERTQVIKGI